MSVYSKSGTLATFEFQSRLINKCERAFSYVLRTLIFSLFLVWLSETCQNEALENIASRDQQEQIQAYAGKLQTIKDVLARRHMKVAFFGR